MFRRITIRELFLVTALAAVLAFEMRERLLPDPLDAYENIELRHETIGEWSKEIDANAELLDGRLVGGFGSGKLSHNGFAIVKCNSSVHGDVVANIKRSLRDMFESVEWEMTIYDNSPETLVATARKDGTTSQMVFQFMSPTQMNDPCCDQDRLVVHWTTTGSSKRINLEWPSR